MARSQEEVDLIVRAIAEGFDQVAQTIKETGDETEGAGDSAGNSASRWTELKSKLDLVKDSFGGVKKVIDLTAETIQRGADVEATAQTFQKLSANIGETEDFIYRLRTATGGMVADFDLMQSANRFMAMGLAETGKEAEDLSKVAVQLGAAMGASPTQAMEDFALMLANQSIPRLDTFGISSGKVRARINELTTGVNALDRETAFMQATMEEARKTMEITGDASENMSADIARLKASTQNLKDMLSQAFAERWSPIIGGMSDLVTTLDEKHRKLNEAVAAGLIPQEKADVLWNRMLLTFNDWDGEAANVINQLERMQEQQAAYNSQLDYVQSLMDQAITTGVEFSETNTNIGWSLDMVKESMERGQVGWDNYQASVKAAAEEEARQVQIFTEMGRAINEASGPIEDWVVAQKDMENASGEFVEVFRDNSREIENINSQLWADLNSEQIEAFNEILANTEEGSNEWVNAYNSLQSDLTESQRAALIARKAELESTQGDLQSIYTGDAQAFEEAQARKLAAEQELAKQLKQSAFDVAEARILAQGGDAISNLQSLLDLQVEMGLTTKEEADMRLTQAENTVKAQEVTQALMDVYLEDGVLAKEEMEKLDEVINFITEDTTLTTESLIAMGTDGLTATENLITGFDDTTTAIIAANIETGKLKNLIVDGLPNKKVIEIEIRPTGRTDLLDGGSGSNTSDVMEEAGII